MGPGGHMWLQGCDSVHISPCCSITVGHSSSQTWLPRDRTFFFQKVLSFSQSGSSHYQTKIFLSSFDTLDFNLANNTD